MSFGDYWNFSAGNDPNWLTHILEEQHSLACHEASLDDDTWSEELPPPPTYLDAILQTPAIHEAKFPTLREAQARTQGKRRSRPTATGRPAVERDPIDDYTSYENMWGAVQKLIHGPGNDTESESGINPHARDFYARMPLLHPPKLTCGGVTVAVYATNLHQQTAIERQLRKLAALNRNPILEVALLTRLKGTIDNAGLWKSLKRDLRFDGRTLSSLGRAILDGRARFLPELVK